MSSGIDRSMFKRPTGSSGIDLKSTLEQKETNVRIVSYNVLSSKLCSSKYHVECTPENLDPTNRLKRLQEKLILHIEQKAIICLQEVSDEWSPHLENFFKTKNYVVYSSQYSPELGILIAYPQDKYLPVGPNVEDALYNITVGEYFEKFTARKTDIEAMIMILAIVISVTINQSFVSFWITILEIVLISSLIYRACHVKFDEWKKAISKQNEVLIVNLIDKETNFPFHVGTYHMPCAYKNPDIMKIHALTVSRIMDDICKSTPYILAGDFNIVPMTRAKLNIDRQGRSLSQTEFNTSQLKTQIYQWLTNGGFYTEMINPSPNFEIARHFRIPPMRSVYGEFRGEPEYTCKSKTKDMEEVFRGTLDYIFVSPSWKIHKVLDIPKDVEKSYPSEKEPSDHFMIGTELSA